MSSDTHRDESVRSHRWVGELLGGLGGGAAFLAWDVLALAWAGRLGLHLGELGAVALLAGLVVLPLSAAAGWLTRLLPPGARAGWPVAAAAGILAPSCLSLGITWFSDPPPFQSASLWQGSVPGFVFVGVLVPLVGLWGLGVLALRRRGFGPTVVGALVLSIVAQLVGGARSMPTLAADGAGPSVLLITLDTTRADRFFDDRVNTPAFDAIADGGVRFDRAYAHIPATGPSHGSMLTGRTPWHNRMMLNGDPVPADAPMLAEAFYAQGYRTGAFISAYVLHGNLGFARGFQVYDDDFNWASGFDSSTPGRGLAMLARFIDPAAVPERNSRFTVSEALSWLEQAPDARFFCWVHLFDAHGPYQPADPWRQRYYTGADPYDPANLSMQAVGEVPPYMRASLDGVTDADWVVAQYDGEIAHADYQMQRLLDWLEQTGRAQDTLVVVVGDHGEGLGEHGEWFHHGANLHEADLHVPLAIRLPNGLAPRTPITQPVELADLGPTITDFAGLGAIEGHQGRSLRPAIERDAIVRPFARSVAWDQSANRAQRRIEPEFPPTYRLVSVRGPDDRLTVSDVDGAVSWFRYDGLRERGGSIGMYRSPVERGRVEALEVAAGRLLDVSSSQGGSAEQPMSEADRAMLEALGYTDGGK